MTCEECAKLTNENRSLRLEIQSTISVNFSSRKEVYKYKELLEEALSRLEYLSNKVDGLEEDFPYVFVWAKKVKKKEKLNTDY